MFKFFKKEREKTIEEIAQLMSKKANCEILPKDIRRHIDRPTTALYSATVYDDPKDMLSGARNVSCLVRRRNKFEYVVTVERI